MIEIIFKPRFVRQLSKLEEPLREEAFEKIELFGNRKNHEQLKVHKLRGRLKGYSSFSVNYRYRIVFEWIDKNTARLLAIGDHAVYGE